MNLIYLVTPFVTWIITGTIKFIINCYREKKLAFHLIGYGGFPSNHSAIVSSSVSLIFFERGFYDPAFCVAITLAFIVLLDAKSLRGQIEKQAKAINILNKKTGSTFELRDRIGHTKFEILGGAVLGLIIGACIHFINHKYNL